MGADAGVAKARDALNASILRVRGVVDVNKGFTIYKTLVGFESIFPPAWDDPNFHYEEEAAYREQRVGEFVAEVNEANADGWFAIIQRCAQTESDDLATFPVFGRFLQKLSQAKPQIVLGFIDRLDERLSGFLGVILSGLAQIDPRADLDAKIAEWLAEEKHLVEMAHYVQLAPKFDPALLRKILALGIKRKEDPALVQVMSAFGRCYADAPDGLIETIFLPAIDYFTERRDARWINLVWFLPQERSPLSTLTAGQTDVVLRSLVHLRRIESHAERVLALMAKSQPEKVFDFFGARLAYAASREDDDSYEEIPFQLHGLEKSFANIADHAVSKVREWFVSGNPMFQFRGGRLLASSFPNFPEAFGGKLQSCVQPGNRDNIEFVIRVLSSYHGEAVLNETCARRSCARSLPAIRFSRTWKLFFRAPVLWSASSDSLRHTRRRSWKWPLGLRTMTLMYGHLPRAMCAFSTGGSPPNSGGARKVSRCASGCMMIPAALAKRSFEALFDGHHNQLSRCGRACGDSIDRAAGRSLAGAGQSGRLRVLRELRRMAGIRDEPGLAQNDSGHRGRQIRTRPQAAPPRLDRLRPHQGRRAGGPHGA
jgi:hypothetical protein